jgi:hypothetical protein
MEQMNHDDMTTLTIRFQHLIEAEYAVTGPVLATLHRLEDELKTLQEPFAAEKEELRRALMEQMFLAGQKQLKTNRFTFSVYQEDVWDRKGLALYAQEQPTVLQFLSKVSRTRLSIK